MFDLDRKLSKNLIIFLLTSFAFISILGMGLSMDTKDGQMSDCPFMADQATMCRMSVTEHISKWQQSLLGIPTKTKFLAFITALLIAVLTSFTKPFLRLKILTMPAASLLAYYKTKFNEVFDPLLVAFSDGILNPKIY